MSLLSGIYLGAGALRTGSDALNTVAHNLSNADTVGYTRQQVSLSTRHYNMLAGSSTVYTQDVGMGVRYAETRQVRDYFLDKTFRKESGRSAFYEVSYTAMIQLEDLLGESGDNNFQESISDFWKTVQNLANDPSSPITQGLFVSKAQTLIERATNVYESVCDYQSNLNTQVKSAVEQINKYGQRIKELNDQIVKIEIGGVEHANDLRDERNAILDELSKLCDIKYSEDVDTYVSVQIEGVDFVKRDTVYEMALDMDENGFYTPYWPQNASSYVNAAGEVVFDPKTAKVFDLQREISSDLNTDIGRVKGLLLARGDHHADSSDLRTENDHYNKNIAQSICMNIQAEFDGLISNIAMAVNDILREAGYDDGSGNADKYLFVRTIPDADPKKGWHVGNIEVNGNFLQQPSLLKMKTADGSVDYETAEKLKDAFNTRNYKLNPNTTKTTNFMEYYSDLVTQISNSGSVYEAIYNSQQVTVEESANAREQVLGVSSDEELQFMIQYQNAYNAASRYINTLNSMLENMLNAFGV